MIQLDITTHIGCPIRCKFCPQDVLVEAYTKRLGVWMMSFNTFKTCIDKLPKPSEINFSGLAEPWLNEHCLDMMLYAHDCGHVITCYTTLQGMKRDIPELICHIPFKYFVIHLPDRNGFSHMTINDEYQITLRKIMKVIPNYGLMCMGDVHPDVLLFLDRVVKSDEKGMHSRAGNIPEMKTVKKTGRLKCLSSELRIDHNLLFPNGDVMICCMDFKMDYILGNLLEGSFEDLFKGDMFKKIQAGLINGEVLCRYCSRSAEVK